MGSKTANAEYSFETMDWDAYMAHRPIYPEALYSLVYDHHASHQGNFDSALDIGAGVGVVTKDLLKKFKHVTLTDASELYVSQAQTMFASLEKNRISFLQRRVEELSLEDVPNGQVDVITAGECLHWTDLEVCTLRAAQLLRPGGTFSAWLYGIQPVYPSSDEAGRKAFDKIYGRLMELFATLVEPHTKTSAGAKMNARFDGMPFDPENWQDVRRIHARLDSPMCSADIPTGESRVRKEESIEKFDNGYLSRKADFEWLKEYLENLLPPLNVKKNCVAELEELKKAMGDRTVELDWPFVLVVATKR